MIGSFNCARSIETILEAHGYVGARSGSYIRPGGGHGSVIIVNRKSIHFNPADELYSEAPGGGYHAQTPFSAFCILDHGGDVRAAVRAAARELGLSPTGPAGQRAGRGRARPGARRGGRGLALLVEPQGGIWMHQRDRDGAAESPLPLCNFVARIVAETVIDDGEHQEEWYRLQAICQRSTREIDLRRTEFESESSLSRIVAALGARARVNPRTQPKYILDAIKAASADVAERVVHTHTGWVGGRYLFTNGYVDAEGWHKAEGCQLPRRLQAYGLAPGGAGLGEGLARLDDLLAMALRGSWCRCSAACCSGQSARRSRRRRRWCTSMGRPAATRRASAARRWGWPAPSCRPSRPTAGPARPTVFSGSAGTSRTRRCCWTTTRPPTSRRSR